MPLVSARPRWQQLSELASWLFRNCAAHQSRLPGFAWQGEGLWFDSEKDSHEGFITFHQGPCSHLALTFSLAERPGLSVACGPGARRCPDGKGQSWGHSEAIVVTCLSRLGGTDIPSAVNRVCAGHDRVVIVTDGQTRPGWLPSIGRWHGGGPERLIGELIPRHVPLCMWRLLPRSRAPRPAGAPYVGRPGGCGLLHDRDAGTDGGRRALAVGGGPASSRITAAGRWARHGVS